MGALANVRNAVASLFGKATQPLHAVDGGRGWTTLGSFGQWGGDVEVDTFDWQRNIRRSNGGVLANWAVFACTTLISSDVGKLRMRLVELDDGIWTEVASPAFSPVLKKPNGYQTWQQFIEAWLVSKLTRGNAYVLKERDNRGGANRGVVTAMHVLNPDLVQPLVSPNGRVFYQLNRDDLAALKEDFPAVPASEIIHDRFNCLFHPLVGLSPIFASGLAAVQGLAMQKNSAKFFKNMSRPSGVLTGPTAISDPLADRLKREWEANYSGDKIGKVAVLGDGLSYQAMTINAVDAELVAQLRMSAEMVCSTFHVPAFKIGAGTIPAGQKVGDLNQIYYADCLQALMESIENLLDDGLGIGVSNPKDGKVLGTEFDLDGLLKMDPTSFMTTLKTAVDGTIMAPNEARRKANMPPAEGGDSPMIQQQNYSLAAIAKRDATADPFGKAAAAPTPAPAGTAAQDVADAADAADAAMKAMEIERAKHAEELDRHRQALEQLTATMSSVQAKMDSDAAERRSAEAKQGEAEASAQEAIQRASTSAAEFAKALQAEFKS